MNNLTDTTISIVATLDRMATKSTRRKFSGHLPRCQLPGKQYYMDVQGPYQTPSIEGNKYVVGCIDGYSRRCFIYYAVSKSDVYRIFTTKFYVNVMRPVFNNYQYSGYMSVISDNGEFKSNDMKMFCNENGIKQNFTCPYTPEHNAPIERLFRILDMMCNAMMAEKSLKQGLWQYVHEASAYLYTRI